MSSRRPAPQAARVIIAPRHVFDQLVLSVAAHDISRSPKHSRCDTLTVLTVIQLCATSPSLQLRSSGSLCLSPFVYFRCISSCTTSLPVEGKMQVFAVQMIEVLIRVAGAHL